MNHVEMIHLFNVIFLRKKNSTSNCKNQVLPYFFYIPLLNHITPAFNIAHLLKLYN